MADEAQNIAPNPPEKLVEEEAVVVTDVPEAEKTDKVVVKESPLPENEEKPLKDEKPVEEATTEVLKLNPVESNDEKIPQSGSFTEESTKVSDLSENERKALGELKQLVQEAINKHDFSSESSPSPLPKVESKAVVSGAEEEKKKETAEDEKKPMEAVASDDSKKESEEPKRDEAESKDGEEVKEKTTVSVVIEDLGNDLDKVVFMHGVDKEGHLVCYNVFGEFQNKELYQKTFSDDEKRQKFLRWRIQFLERSKWKLDFIPGGISTIVQVNDLKNSPGPGKWELRQATKQALHLLQDNYPEFVAKQVFINVPR